MKTEGCVSNGTNRVSEIAPCTRLMHTSRSTASSRCRPSHDVPVHHTRMPRAFDVSGPGQSERRLPTSGPTIVAPAAAHDSEAAMVEQHALDHRRTRTTRSTPRATSSRTCPSTRLLAARPLLNPWLLRLPRLGRITWPQDTRSTLAGASIALLAKARSSPTAGLPQLGSALQRFLQITRFLQLAAAPLQGTLLAP